MTTDALVLLTDLIDHSIVTTDFDAKHQRFRTTHTQHDMTKEIYTWPSRGEARDGHYRSVRELTAAISMEGHSERQRDRVSRTTRAGRARSRS